MDEKKGIGKANKIPWHIKEDMKCFKSLTLGHPVIMGRKTYESIGRPLPNRINIVVTRDTTFNPHKFCSSENCDVFVAHSLDKALEIAGEKRGSEEKIFIIGGGEIYRQTLPLVDKLYLTIVEGDYNCDTFFPDYSEFKKVIHEESIESEGYKYNFLELVR